LLLKEVAKRLKTCLRRSDTVARIGGDEFTCVLLDIEKTGDITKVAQKIKKALSNSYDFNGYNVKISGSIGISTFPEDTKDARQLIKNADIAMYHAKKQGKNSYEFFSAGLNEVVLDHISVKNNIHRELESQELLFHYQ
ncbi:MAG: GGDEF domain-containing protein, partial [Nitrospirota bacterium]|nr:GGDEF domain-containing protein [Nitrospirota bacterium]